MNLRPHYDFDDDHDDDVDGDDDDDVDDDEILPAVDRPSCPWI